MSHSISILLTRNVHDVFGENGPARRRAAIDELFTEDGVFYDPSRGAYRGRDAIDRVAGAIRATHPDFRYQPIAEPEEVGNGGRIQWVSGRPDDAPAYAGTDNVAGDDVSRVQDRTSASYNAAAEQRSLSEWKLLGHDGELVLVDQRPF